MSSPSRLRLIDSHCHLHAPELDSGLDIHIASAQDRGVERFIVPGTRQKEWRAQLLLAARYRGVYPALGLHPLFLQHHREDDLLQLASLCANRTVVAVGEIGLDFYAGLGDEVQQRRLFQQQLDIAEETGLPVILHARKADDQLLSILRKSRFQQGGVVHAFGGSLQQARQYIDLGFALGIGGSISYDRAKARRRIAAELPLEAIVLETDAPYMSLAGQREGPNLPERIADVLHILSGLRPESTAAIAGRIYQNTLDIFSLEDYDLRRGPG